jgi:hypothetical protein
MFLLVLASFASGYVALFSAFVFTFFVPGLIFQRFFSLKSYEKWAFVPVFGVLFSVEFIYFLSLAFGYSKETVLFSFLALTAMYTLVVFKKGQDLKPQSLLKFKKIKKTTILLFAVIFLISLAVLAKSVWSSNEYGIVLTGVNMQDAPFHYEIIENLNQGNFPPQTPNYIGIPLSYHYFVDFHTAILEKMYGYLPTLLPFLNAVFIGVFALAIYALARPYGRRASIVAAVIAVFGWGLSYVGLFSELFSGQSVVTQSYFQFQGTFGLPPIFDNLLNQRPLLIGLPAFALVLSLLQNMDDKNRLILAGVITGLVYQFHNVAFFCCYVAFAVCLLFNLKHFKFSSLYFLVPTVLALPFILGGGASFSASFSSRFVEDFVKNPFVFYPLTLGVPFFLAILTVFKRGNAALKATFVVLFLIPNVLLMTPWDWDMYKFFIFAWVPIAVLCGVVLGDVWVRGKLWKPVVLAAILFSILTSASVIIYNVGSNDVGANWAEYNAGLWVRDNTPQNSVFLTYYGIHEPTSMIGGRLRVSSYVYWPYGHGEPLDQINQREHDIDSAYNGTEAQLTSVIHEYSVSYVYVGTEEIGYYTTSCITHFDSMPYLTTIYSEGDLRIYQVDYAKMG